MIPPTSRSAPPRLRAFVCAVGAVAAGVVLSIGLLLVQWLQEERAKLLFIGLDGMNQYLAIGAISILGIGIAMVRVRPRGKSVVACAILIVAIGVGASCLIRVDGYYGNRTPRIAWNWSPKAETVHKSYLASSHLRKLPVSLGCDFTPTSFDFSELLGPGRSGKLESVSLFTDWDLQKPDPLWKHPLGLGWSSFATVGNAAVTLEQRDELECVVCYDLMTGAEVWCHGEQTRFRHEYGDGPRSTPTIHSGRAFSMGATGILTCVDVSSGELMWKQSVFADAASQNLIFGMTGSPLVVGGVVIVTPGAGSGASAIAYSTENGSEIWRAGDDPASYASPVAIQICGSLQILSFNGEGLRSYASNGEPLWLQPWVTQGDSRVNVAQPIALPSIDEPMSSRVLVSSGYDKGTAMIRISSDGHRWKSEVVWESKLLKSKLSNVVVRGDFAYGLDNGILACIRLKDGERVWKAGRYGHGKILLVRNKLLVQAESGEIVLVEATDKAHIELTRFEALSSKTWNYMALAGDVLVVRNDREGAAFRLPTAE
jgi:outer membrane protein assembly factor BamB